MNYLFINKLYHKSDSIATRRLANRHEIAELQLELKSLEARFQRITRVRVVRLCVLVLRRHVVYDFVVRGICYFPYRKRIHKF